MMDYFSQEFYGDIIDMFKARSADEMHDLHLGITAELACAFAAEIEKDKVAAKKFKQITLKLYQESEERIFAVCLIIHIFFCFVTRDLWFNNHVVSTSR